MLGTIIVVAAPAGGSGRAGGSGATTTRGGGGIGAGLVVQAATPLKTKTIPANFRRAPMTTQSPISFVAPLEHEIFPKIKISSTKQQRKRPGSFLPSPT
jgi:hypothetical protein